jgi:hypothetical protein
MIIITNLCESISNLRTKKCYPIHDTFNIYDNMVSIHKHVSYKFLLLKVMVMKKIVSKINVRLRKFYLKLELRILSRAVSTVI